MPLEGKLAYQVSTPSTTETVVASAESFAIVTVSPFSSINLIDCVPSLTLTFTLGLLPITAVASSAEMSAVTTGSAGLTICVVTTKSLSSQPFARLALMPKEYVPRDCYLTILHVNVPSSFSVTVTLPLSLV